METSLHGTLKRLYCGEHGVTECRLGGYRVDALVGETAVEIQAGSLAALREKVPRLLQSGHRVLVVKPFPLVTVAVNLASGRRWRQVRCALEVFEDLVHIPPWFPSPGLTIDLVFVEQMELRRRRGKRRWIVEDRKLIRIDRVARLQGAADLWGLLPHEVRGPFTTRLLAQIFSCPIWLARMIAYTLSRSGAARRHGTENRYVRYVPIACA